jgi:hypothetical protein
MTPTNIDDRFPLKINDVWRTETNACPGLYVPICGLRAKKIHRITDGSYGPVPTMHVTSHLVTLPGQQHENYHVFFYYENTWRLVSGDTFLVQQEKQMLQGQLTFQW